MALALYTKVESTECLLVGWFPVHTVPKGVIWSSVYVNIQEGKMAVRLSLHSELYVGIYVVKVVEEVLQLLSPWGQIT
jgi:hypothetical protein